MEKLEKVGKGGEKLGKVGKSVKKCEKSEKRWGKVAKSLEKVGEKWGTWKKGLLKNLDKMAAGGHFGCPKITFDHSSCHFRSIRNFFFKFLVASSVIKFRPKNEIPKHYEFNNLYIAVILLYVNTVLGGT